MPTATLHLASVPKFAGATRCYRLDPPTTIGDQSTEFVNISLIPAQPALDAEVMVLPATATGASTGPTVRKRAGSFVPNHNPLGPDGGDEYIDGCYSWALQQLGYTLAAD